MGVSKEVLECLVVGNNNNFNSLPSHEKWSSHTRRLSRCTWWMKKDVSAQPSCASLLDWSSAGNHASASFPLNVPEHHSTSYCTSHLLLTPSTSAPLISLVMNSKIVDQCLAVTSNAPNLNLTSTTPLSKQPPELLFCSLKHDSQRASYFLRRPTVIRSELCESCESCESLMRTALAIMSSS